MNDDNRRALLDQFHAEMMAIYTRAKSEIHYNATRYLQLVSERGGLAAAQILLKPGAPSDGFTTLWMAGRLDLTVEALVQRPEFIDLFGDDELAVARERTGPLK